MVNRKRHPFISALSVSDASLGELLVQHATDHPVFQALRALRRSRLEPATAARAYQYAEQVLTQCDDPELAFVLYATWASFAAEDRRLTEAAALNHRAAALLRRDAPPGLAILVTAVETEIAANSGRSGDAEELLRRILRTLPPNLPSRKKFTLWLCALLARQGRGGEAQADLDWLERQCNDSFKLGRVAHVRVEDYVERGWIEPALRYLHLWSQDNEQVRLFAELNDAWKILLDLMQGRWSYGALLPQKEAPVTALRVQAWLWATFALLRREPAVAYDWARHFARNDLDALNGSGFQALTLLRAELASGRFEAARRRLQHRQQRGLTHYLDDFFRARIELGAGRKPQAAACMQRALKSAERHGALPRFNFELLLACEVAPSDLLDLGRRTEQPRAPQSAETAAIAAPNPADPLVGGTPALAAIRDMVQRFAALPMPVLLTGESGVAKAAVARALHESGPRRTEPFLVLNCSALSETLLESELFGLAKGAASVEREHKGLIEAAGTGTLFLDEISALSPRLQDALLAVLETGESRPVGGHKPRKINCRIVAATSIDFDQVQKSGVFRRELLTALRRLEIHLPPLRARRDDILPLAEHFLKAGAPDAGVTLSPALSAALTAYAWPGNVRELRGEMERLRALNFDKAIFTPEDIDEPFHSKLFGKPAPQEELSTETISITQSAPTIAAVTPPALPPVGLLRKRSSAPAAPNPNPPAPVSARIGPPVIPAAPETVFADSRAAFRRLEKLRTCFRQHKQLTRAEAARILGISVDTATRDLKQLCTEGLIQKVRPSASPRSHYFALKDG